MSGLVNGTYYYKVIVFNQYGNYSTECVQVNVVIPYIPPEPEDKDSFIFHLKYITYIIFGILLGILILVYIKLKK